MQPKIAVIGEWARAERFARSLGRARNVRVMGVLDPLRRALCALFRNPTMFDRGAPSFKLPHDMTIYPGVMLDGMHSWAVSRDSTILLDILERDAALVGPRPVIAFEVDGSGQADYMRADGWRLVWVEESLDGMETPAMGDIHIGIDGLDDDDLRDVAVTAYDEIVAALEGGKDDLEEAA